MLVLNMFDLVFRVYGIMETTTSVQNGSKSEIAKRLDEVLNKMEQELN